MAYIDNAFVKKFHNDILMALQQKGSRLANLVERDVLQGEQEFFDFLEADDDIAEVGTNYAGGDPLHPDTVITDPTWTRRMVTGTYLTKAYIVNKRDVLKLLRDPTNRYIQSIAWAMGRKQDKLIISAATGNAYTGRDGTVAVALPASQQTDLGDAGLTFKKLKQARQILEENEVSQDEPTYLVLPPRQVFHLLDDLLASNLTRDAETVKAITEGNLDTYMGFTFVKTNLTLTETVTLSDGTTTATADVVFAYAKSGLLLAVSGETEASIDKRPDKNNDYQIFFGMYAGATRMDEKRVVKIDCVQ